MILLVILAISSSMSLSTVINIFSEDVFINPADLAGDFVEDLTDNFVNISTEKMADNIVSSVNDNLVDDFSSVDTVTISLLQPH